MSTLLSDLRAIDLTDDFGEAAGRVPLISVPR